MDEQTKCGSCEGWWRLPAAEQGTVVGVAADEQPVGNVAQANLAHRTDWSLPRRTAG
ncbi:hypothetical protein GCM10010492_66590 [Saccharothrix mutabilis subsp. mutabilis]|uniref:Uncharacterized protein n=1 Tax=Saccharothrix mutabilis subsp. mutabilis TaxID=66855 RepID=A0ABP3EAA7_9PSEU